MQKCYARPLQLNGQKTTAKHAKKRRASPSEYDIGSGLGQSGQKLQFIKKYVYVLMHNMCVSLR